MNNKLLCLGGAFAAAIFSLAAPTFAQMSHTEPAGKGGGHDKMQSMPMSGSSPDMMQTMKKGMNDMQSMPMSGDTDIDFAKMMRMHHQQALDMAQMELKHGKDASMKRMAQKILDGQRKEIKEFDAWLAKHK